MQRLRRRARTIEGDELPAIPAGRVRLRPLADGDPRNAPSIRIVEKLGFVREGLLRGRWHVGGEVQDSVILGLLRREWEAGAGRAGDA